MKSNRMIWKDVTLGTPVYAYDRDTLSLMDGAVSAVKSDGRSMDVEVSWFHNHDIDRYSLNDRDMMSIMITGKVDGKEVAIYTDKTAATEALPAYERGDEEPALSQGEALYSLLSMTTTPVFARKYSDIYACAKTLRDNLENSGAWQTFRNNGFSSQPYGERIRGMLSGYKNLIAVLRYMQGTNDLCGLLDKLSALDLDNEESILGKLVDLSEEIDSLTLGK